MNLLQVKLNKNCNLIWLPLFLSILSFYSLFLSFFSIIVLNFNKRVVGRINGRFGRVGYVPVELYNQRIKKEEICALYRYNSIHSIND